MNSLLKILLIALFICFALVKADENTREGEVEVEGQEQEEIQGEEEVAGGDDDDDEVVVEDNTNKLIKVTIVTKIEGTFTKVAVCEFNQLEMEKSIPKLQAAGTDIDTYDRYHRGIELENCQIKNQEIAQKLLQKVTAGYMIPYRYLGVNMAQVSDVHLGNAVVGHYKVGYEASDFNCEIAFVFGKCRVARTHADDADRERITRNQVNAFKAVTEELARAHKEFLDDKITKAVCAAREYDSYASLYKDALVKKSFTAEIPNLEAKLSAKTGECDSLQKTYETSKAAYDNEHTQYENNKKQIDTIECEILELEASKKALDKEQVEAINLKSSYEARQNDMEKSKNSIQAAIYTIKALSPNYFDGCGECITSSSISQCCLDRVRAGP